jgi:uncharacterized protein YjbI with pentapeptide repeats
MNKKETTERWNFAQPFDVSEAPFGWTEGGYKDFRGAPINRYRKVLGCRFMKCDLSGADFSGIELRELEFTDCRFVSTNFASVQDRSNLFVGCVFRKCSFQDTYFGIRPRWRRGPSRYEDCVFEGCDFRNALFRNGVFKRTVFDGNRTNGVDSSASGFWDCQFIGLVEDVWFRGGYPHPDHYKNFGVPVEPGLHRVDFSQAKLVMIAVSDGCSLEDITLPTDCSCDLYRIGELLIDSAPFAEGFGDDNALVAKAVDWLTVYANSNGLSAPQESGLLCRHDIEEFLSGITERSAELAAAIFDKIKSRYGFPVR